ncbi:sterol carrier protein [Natronomonas amylolytica]|uniref:sterol carrier protein n=1 Tax=Natronomonas amylolytica TaxID=3108498 RepID=UPI00300A2AF4
MALYPSERWLDEYARRLDESRALDDVAAGWGDGFDGDIRLVITDLPLAETAVADLPDSVLDGVPEAVRSQLATLSLAELTSVVDENVRAGLPEGARRLLTQLDENVVDGTLYAHLSLEDGACTDAKVLGAPDEREAGFSITGSYETWRSIVDGRPALSAMLEGDLAVDGSRTRQLQYFAIFQLLGDVAANVETTHVFPEGPSNPGEVVLDNAVRPTVLLQRFAHRQASWAGRTLNLL